MNKRLMLDATPLGLLARRRPARDDLLRLDALLSAGIELFLPEIADFEVRRSFVLHNLKQSIRELDFLKAKLIYVPISTSAILQAASMWADARRKGTPTADPHELDCDVILAAQANEVGAEVATENVGHLGRYVTVHRWTALATR
jgi:predicted nucleic acid-binding protein